MSPEGAKAVAVPALTVVVACDGAVDRLPDRLAALSRACAGIATEVIVVHADEVRVSIPTNAPLETTAVPVRSSLVPVLWGRGMARARAPIVALTTTQFRMRDGWARALLDGFSSSDVAGVGGSIALAGDSAMLRTAVFLIRYSEHIASPGLDAPKDIAGDNAAYRREIVRRVWPDLSAGFWEVDVHRLMRAAGYRITHAPAAVAEFAAELSFAQMLANRFVHGSHFGAFRVSALRWPRWRAVAVTPLVPAVLVARIVGRMRRAGQPLASTLRFVPMMLPLLVAWAAGEARGALSRGRTSTL